MSHYARIVNNIMNIKLSLYEVVNIIIIIIMNNYKILAILSWIKNLDHTCTTIAIYVLVVEGIQWA